MRLLRQPDFYLALVCLLGGAYLAFLASAYEARARHFPFWLSLTIALCGGLMMANALIRGIATTPKSEDVQAVLRGALPFALIMLLWVVCLTYGLGYVLPGAACAAGLLWIAGERRPIRLVIMAILIVLICYLTFSVGFNVNLPELDVISDLFRPIRRLIH